MKHIITFARSDGSFDEVGMNNRTIFTGSLPAARKFVRIQQQTLKRAARIETFTTDENFYKEKPYSVYVQEYGD